MPLRMRAPYLPRVLRAPARVPAGRPAARGGRGAIGPGGIDTTPTGNPGVDLVKAINATIQTNRQNAIANQILNTQAPPRAGLVAPGVNPASGAANVIPANVPVTGTPPQSGGVGELQMRQQLQQQNLADQLQQAKIAAQLALVRQRSGGGGGGGGVPGSGSRWRQQLTQQPQQPGGGRGGKGGKPAPYVAGSGDVQNDSSTDNFSQIQADFDAQHGKGAYNAFVKNFSNLAPDGKGNLAVVGDDGKPVMGKDGVTPLYSIPAKDADFWMQRYNAARIGSGQDYLGNPPPGSNPNSGQPSGSQVNPFAPKNNLEVRSLPYGSYMIDPGTGQLTIKQRPTQGTQGTTQSAEQPAKQSTAQPADQATDQAAQQQAEAPDDESESASADQAAVQPNQLVQATSDQDEARRRQAMLSLAMNQPGAGSLYPAQDVMS